jgi:hypothetical protein
MSVVVICITPIANAQKDRNRQLQTDGKPHGQLSFDVNPDFHQRCQKVTTKGPYAN